FLEDFYSLKDPSAVDKKVLKEAIYQRWPITKEMAIYVLPTDGNGAVSYKEQLLIDNIIKNSCPDYTFEDLEYDHALTQYEGADISNIETANFKLSLEYTYEKDRLTATLSEDGVSYDEKLYVLDEITILPYNSGYTLLSDGSGAMVEFEGRDIPQDKTNIDTGDNSEITNTQSNAPILIAVIFGIIIFFFIVIIILLFLLIRKKIKVKR
ncbi:MAG: hypothetical protein IJ303_04995, partial [Clostridia bacterium]|nr:hypothetical protein [Clostridia bacterium]